MDFLVIILEETRAQRKKKASRALVSSRALVPAADNGDLDQEVVVRAESVDRADGVAVGGELLSMMTGDISPRSFQTFCDCDPGTTAIEAGLPSEEICLTLRLGRES